jgi:DNA primase
MDKSEQVMKWLGEAGGTRIRVSGDDAVSTCPFHRDQKPSFAISLVTGLYTCYSASCGARGNLAQFLMNGLGWAPRKAIETAGELVTGERATMSENLVSWESRRSMKAGKATESALLEAVALSYMCVPYYMTGRGFTEATLLKWEIGFDPKGLRVTIPVRDADGACVGISKRAVLKSQTPPYLHDGFSKGKYLYGAHHPTAVPSKGMQEVWVSEGQLDAMALNQIAPHLKAVSTMGSLVTPEQIGLLGAYSRVIIAFDNHRIDEAGRKATSLVGEALIRTMDPGSVYVADAYPEGVKDAGDLLFFGSTEHRKFLDQITPYEEWRLRFGELKRKVTRSRVTPRR